MEDNVDYVTIVPFNKYDISRAKQRASIKWLLSKAYDNKVPEDLIEPYYKDHEGQEHLKPHIVRGLSDAELYCMALCNLYADPNYSQLSPLGVVQVLYRKGINVQNHNVLDPTHPQQLTETILIQNTPLKLSAHMTVIESLMALQVKELISTDRIINTVQKYGPHVHPREMPSDIEECLLLWINRCILGIKKYIQNNNAHEHHLTSILVDNWNSVPLFQDLSDLSDGVGLCSLLAYYCEEELALTEIVIPSAVEPLSVSDSIWNVQLVHRVCRDSLPYNVYHFQIEDLIYYNHLFKQNVLNLLTDLYYVFELQQPQPSAVRIIGSHLPKYQIYQSGISGSNTSRNEKTSTIGGGLASRSLSSTGTPTKRYSNTMMIEKNRSSILNEDSGKNVLRCSSSPTNSLVSIPIPKRSGTPQDYNDKSSSEHKNSIKDSRSSEDSEDFVVHKGRTAPTLSQVMRSISPSLISNEDSGSRVLARNHDDDNAPAAGRPSNWNENKTTYAGRRSRRNSVSEADSQLTVENFGGSQDNLNKLVLGRNPDKQPAIVTDNTISPVRYPRRQTSVEPPDYYESSPHYVSMNNDDNDNSDDNQSINSYFSSASRKPKQYARSECGTPIKKQYYSQHAAPEPYYNSQFERNGSNGTNNVTVYVVNDGGDSNGPPSSNYSQGYTVNPGPTPQHAAHHVAPPPLRSSSMTNLSRLSDIQSRPVDIVYLQDPNNSSRANNMEMWTDRAHSNYIDYPIQTLPPQSAAYSNRNSFYSSPVHYSHQQQAQKQQRHSTSPYDDYYSPHSSSNQSHYHNKNHHHQPQQPPSQDPYNRSYVHQGDNDEEDEEDLAAQLAAIRVKLEEKRKRIEMEKGRLEKVATKQQAKLGKDAYRKAIHKINSSKKDGDGVHAAAEEPPATMNQELANKKKQLSLKDLESKWLSKTEETCRTPEIENMDIETYTRNLTKLETSLTELDSDLKRLPNQKEQSQRQFFLHGSDEVDEVAVGDGKRRSWNIPGDDKWSNHSRNSVKIPSSRYSDDIDARESLKYPSSSFRLHSNAESQGNRLFHHNTGVDELEHEEEFAGDTILNEKPKPPPRQSKQSVYNAPLPTPPLDDMEPQSVCFVQDDATGGGSSSNEMASISSSKKSSLQQITSGSKTYRITPESGSPPRPTLNKVFNSNGEVSYTSSEENTSINNERGFYIPFEGPKRPKPPLRTKSPSKRKEDREALRNSKRDITSEYVQSIVNQEPLPPNNDDEEDEFGNSENALENERVLLNNNVPVGGEKPGGQLVIDEKPNFNSNEIDMMEKKKERIILQSLKRQQAVEESRRIKEMQMQQRREEEAMKQEEKLRKKEEEKLRRQAILEEYRLKKAEEMEKEKGWQVQESSAKRFLRPKSSNSGSRPRPKTIHLPELDSGAHTLYNQRPHSALKRSDSQNSTPALSRSHSKRGSSNNIYADTSGHSRSNVRDPWGSTSSLNQDSRRRSSTSYDRRSRPRDLSTSRLEARTRRDSYLGSQEFLGPRVCSTSSLLDGTGAEVESNNSKASNNSVKSYGGGHRDSDSGVGTCSPPNRQSPSPSRKRKTKSAGPIPSCSLPSPCGPESLPPGLISRRRGFDDGASDISSVTSSNMDYSGPRLYKQPTAKSNRTIILNAVEYCVFPGAVNRDAKMRVLDEINRSESKHFLIMFRDAGCQFRALYSYDTETEEVVKLYGTGPRFVTDDMFEKFFKYNSGGKRFSQVHTKHLTVTIDAFTIHNALWQGKRAPAARTRDLPLVI